MPHDSAPQAEAEAKPMPLSAVLDRLELRLVAIEALRAALEAMERWAACDAAWREAIERRAAGALVVH